MMTIRGKLLGMSGVMGVALVLLAVGAHFGVSSLGSEMVKTTTVATALRNHTNADMMHDALRADVYFSLFDGSHGGNDRKQAMAEFSDHAKAFKHLIEANKALELPASVRDHLQTVKKPLEDYVALANEIIQLAYEDFPMAVLKLPDFDQAFSKLEVAMEATGDGIETIAKSYQADADAIQDAMEVGVTVAIGFAIVLMGAMFWTVIVGTIAPFARIERAMISFAEGNHAVEVPTERQDEAGSMARSLVAYREALGRAEENAKRMQAQAVSAERKLVSETIGIAIERLAANDLSHRITVALPGEYEELRNGLNEALDTLSAALSQVRAGCRDVDSSSSEINEAVGNLSIRTESQAAGLEETSSAIGSIATTLTETSQISKEARDLVSATVAETERSSRVVTRATEAMNAIEAASRQMDTVITVIDEIAFQTNLLALNAGVEAARAGNAGRGFAVVASEVRALALRSADAAKEIRALIASSKDQVVEGVGLVGQAGAALDAIKGAVTRINQAVGQIAERMQEQSASIEQVTQAVATMDEATQQNAAMAEETSAATRSLAVEAQDMLRLVSRFQTGGADTARARGAIQRERAAA